ncbi:MAG: class I SAM-dependent methyltransferase [Thermodesulfobacteriota bacterium]
MEEEKRSREGLMRLVLSQIEERGAIPFAQFMEGCLYHPEYGYYRSEKRRTGKDGDYYTSPCVHPLFGYLIAKQLSQMAEKLGGGTFDVVEMGGGRGLLCMDVLDWAKKNSPGFYKRLRYHLIETAPNFLREQKEKLSGYSGKGKVFWLDPLELEKEKLRIQGCFLSNELIDSFPVHRVVLDQGHLKEIYVSQEDGRLKEALGEPSDRRISDYLGSMGVILEEGQRAEVNLEALDWMEKVARSLEKGFVLTIDYGYLAEELYAPFRMGGTFRCYYCHQTYDDPFERLGEQDMTAHVNFTGLVKKGEEVGLKFTGLVSQYHFLIGLGILQEMESLQRNLSEIDGLRLRLSLKHLIEPEAGMGEVFKVLVQHKGIEKPQLDGLRELRSIPWT